MEASNIIEGPGSSSFVLRTITPIISKWGSNGPKVKIIDSVKDLPLEFSATGRVQGVYDPKTGTVYLVSDGMSSKEVVLKTLAHESVGHFGIQQMLGDQYQQLIDDVQRLKGISTRFKGYARAVRRDYGALPIDVESGEILALMAERGVKHPLITRAVAAVRAWLRRLGFSIPMSEVDVSALIVSAGHWLRSNSGGEFKDVGPTLPQTRKQALQAVRKLDEAYKSIPDTVVNKVSDFRPTWLKALTRRHLSEIGKRDLPSVAQYVRSAQNMDAERNELMSESADLSEKWQKYNSKNKREADELANLMHDTTIAGVDPSVIYKAITTAAETKQNIKVLKEKARGRSGSSTGPFIRQIEQANIKLMQEAKREGAYPELLARWKSLSVEAQEIYKEVRDAYSARSEETLEVILGRIDQYVHNEKHKAALKESVRLQFESARVQAPYFPLARFGDYWATSFDSNEDVVEMSMFETQGAQKAWISEQEEEGLNVKHGFKTRSGDMIKGVDSEFVMNIELMVDKADNKDELKDSIYQLYLQMLPDLSMRKSFIHRKATRGFAKDALRSFSHQMFHGSYQLARMKHTPMMEVALNNAEEQVSKSQNPNRAAQIFNEIQERHDWAMNPKGAQWANNVSSFGFTMFLGLSPAAALVNTTQTALVALPILGSKFGWDNSSKELLRAAKDYFAGGFDIEKSLSGNELKAYLRFVKEGLIDKTLAHDLAGIAEQGGEYSNKTHRVMKVVSSMFHQAEKFNREVTSVAAYRLASKAGKSHIAAMDIAEELTWDSHFDYSSGNKAKFMQNDTAKVIFMFKQFSLNMSFLLLRNSYQSLKGESSAVKSEARKTLIGVLGMHFLFAGAMGLPVLLPMLFAIANLIFDDEDEPWDAETEFRKFLADYLGKTAGRVLANGPANELSGIDIASRVSLDGLWVRSSWRDLEGREVAAYWAGQLLGPMFGTAGNVAAGIDMMSEGKIQRGVETMMPTFAKNVMKSVRYYSEGVNNFRGDQLIDDVGGGEVFWQSMGFAPARVGDQYDKNRYVKNKERRILDRKSLLLNKLSLAINQGDDDLKSDTMDSIRRFNSKNPRVVITMDSIVRSLKMRKLYSAKSISGINLSDKLRYIGEEVDQY